MLSVFDLLVSLNVSIFVMLEQDHVGVTQTLPQSHINSKGILLAVFQRLLVDKLGLFVPAPFFFNWTITSKHLSLLLISYFLKLLLLLIEALLLPPLVDL